MNKIAIGIIGYGTVGQGVVEVLTRNASEIARRSGYEIAIKKVAKRNWQGFDVATLPFACTTDPWEVINDPNIAIILELAGGEHPAREWTLAALQAGKHVITANKALIAKFGNELFAAAQKFEKILTFEAAVAGGIPVIKVLREGMGGNEINKVAGIINGTGNFILTAMSDKEQEFADVLQEAQDLGYAEADPSFDIQGTDAAHKITILAALAFGIPLQFDRVYTEGITAITPDDIRNAEALGYKIKHLGLAVRRETGVEIRVHPTLVPKSALLSSVNGVMNAVQVQGNAIGTSLLYGPGAGKLPTASAVIADLIDVVRALNLTPADRIAELGYIEMHDQNVLPVLPAAEFRSAYYLRLVVADKVGVLEEITHIFAVNNISLSSVIQKTEQRQNNHIPLILLTEVVKEDSIERAIAQLANLDAVTGAITRIRIETLE